MKRFGEKLRTLRKMHGYTLQQIGDMLGVNNTFVSKLERGYRIPNAEMILKIANIFGVSTDQLMRDDIEIE